jgi:hypothetical protein
MCSLHPSSFLVVDEKASLDRSIVVGFSFCLAVDEALAVLEGRREVRWFASPAAVGESRVRFGRWVLVEVC